MDELQTPRPPWNPIVAFGLALGVFVVTTLVGKSVPESVTSHIPWARQVVGQGLMVAVAFAAMAVSGRPFAEFGFRRPVPAKGHFILCGLALGAASTGIILALGLKGMRGVMGRYGLPNIILWVWLFSSTVEEVFCRGWFQSLVAGADKSDAHRTRMAIISSAALFGSMHLALLFSGMEIAAVALIVLSVTALGYVCATARARTGSLLPAIAAHMMFNVGGFLAGMIYTIGFRIATGHLPSP